MENKGIVKNVYLHHKYRRLAFFSDTPPKGLLGESLCLSGKIEK